MDLTYSGVITAKTASPEDSLLLARPKGAPSNTQRRIGF